MMAETRDPLDKRVLLWTGRLTKAHRKSLHVLCLVPRLVLFSLVQLEISPGPPGHSGNLFVLS